MENHFPGWGGGCLKNLNPPMVSTKILTQINEKFTYIHVPKKYMGKPISLRGGGCFKNSQPPMIISKI